MIKDIKVYYAGIGLIVWVLATAIFRLGGHLFFQYENRSVMILLFFLTGIALFLFTTYLLKQRVTLPSDTACSAVIWLVLPGMLLDAVAVLAFPRFFSNLSEAAAGLLLGGYFSHMQSS